jgi:hypothetical protein
MARTDVYERILDELADGELEDLEIKIFHHLRRVFPASMTRYDLIEVVFGERPAEGENLNNNKDDRKIRSAIASMFDKGVPIVSTSGGAGYSINIDLENWSTVVNEIGHRKETLEKKETAARRIIERIQKLGRDAIPSHVPAHYLSAPTAGPVPQSGPRQLSFMGGEQ